MEAAKAEKLTCVIARDGEHLTDRHDRFIQTFALGSVLAAETVYFIKLQI